MGAIEALLKEFKYGNRKVANYVEEIIDNVQSNADLGAVISLDEENLKCQPYGRFYMGLRVCRLCT